MELNVEQTGEGWRSGLLQKRFAREDERRQHSLLQHVPAWRGETGRQQFRSGGILSYQFGISIL